MAKPSFLRARMLSQSPNQICKMNTDHSSDFNFDKKSSFDLKIRKSNISKSKKNDFNIRLLSLAAQEP